MNSTSDDPLDFLNDRDGVREKRAAAPAPPPIPPQLPPPPAPGQEDDSLEFLNQATVTPRRATLKKGAAVDSRRRLMFVGIATLGALIVAGAAVVILQSTGLSEPSHREREAVRRYLKENLPSGQWEEIQWWKPIRHGDSIRRDPFGDADGFRTLDGIRRAVNPAAPKTPPSVQPGNVVNSDDYIRVGTKWIRLKYRTFNGGIGRVEDHMFMLDEKSDQILRDWGISVSLDLAFFFVGREESR